MSSCQALFHVVSLAAFVAAGFQVVWYVVLAVAYQTIASAWAGYPISQILVDAEGVVFIEDRSASGISHRTLEGEPVAVDDDKNWLDPSLLVAPMHDRARNATLPWRSRTAQFYDESRPPTTWFFVHSPANDGSGYFVGYDAVGNSRIGYLGRRGFHATMPPAEEWLSVAGPPGGRSIAYGFSYHYLAGRNQLSATALLPKSNVYLVADGQLWRINLHRRTLTRLDGSSDAVSVNAAKGVPRDVRSDPKDETATESSLGFPHKGLLLRKQSEVLAIDFGGRHRTSWPLPAELQSQQFEWYELPDGRALAQSTTLYTGTVWVRDLHWIDQQGKITRTERVELSRERNDSAMLESFGVAALAPDVLVAVPAALVVAPFNAVANGWQPNYPTALAQVLVDAWPALVLLLLLSGALAWLAYRRQIRYSLPGAGAWAVFVFLLGVPGWLAYRWHRRWPVLAECGECHCPAPRDRETCAACGHLFAALPLMGTEVFA